MKRGTPDHPKTLRLARLLNIPQATAVGLLEMLWHFTGKYAVQGDIGRFQDGEIAQAAGWLEVLSFLEPSDTVSTPSRHRLDTVSTPSRHRLDFVSTLHAAGWIDPDPVHRWLIHDWADHADEAVKKVLKRRGLWFAVRTMTDAVSTPSRQEPDAVSTPAAENRTALAIAIASPLPEQTALSVDQATPAPSPNLPPSLDSPQSVLWVKQALADYMRGRWGEPDDAICGQVLEIGKRYGVSLAIIGAVLKEVHVDGKAPSRSWPWFIPVIEEGVKKLRPQGLARVASAEVDGLLKNVQ